MAVNAIDGKRPAHMSTIIQNSNEKLTCIEIDV